MRRLIAALAAVALSAGAADAAAPYRAPRTSTGAPDLQGVWTNSALTFLVRPPVFKSLIATDAEAAQMHKMFLGFVGDLIKPTADPKGGAPAVVKEAPQADYLEMDLNLARVNGQMRSSWIVDPADGQIPFTDAGRKAFRAANKETFDDPEARPLTERCLTAVGSPDGPPMLNTGFNANYQIVQTRDHVAIEIEMNHDVRIIRLTDRKHAPEAIRLWLGDSVGWWDGDTLVVETTNLKPGVTVSSLGGGFAYSAGTRIIERFTRTGPNEILYEFTINDPAQFKRTWSAQMPMHTSKGPIYEYACHEGNYGVANALSGARYEDAHPAPKPAAAEAKPAAAPAPQAGPAPQTGPAKPATR